MNQTNTEKDNVVVAAWNKFKEKHPNIAEFLVFFLISNGVTVFQMIIMPLLKWVFNQTDLVNVAVKILHFHGDYYLFHYAGGPIQTDGSGGGMAYFLAVEIALLLAQIINFFLQRNVTFKSNSNIWVAAFWYLLAFVAITVIAAGLQSLYKDPIYSICQKIMGSIGVTVADLITMIINCAISFWVFYPIFKIIFKKEK